MFAGAGAVGRIGRPGLSGRHGTSLLSGMTLSLDFMQPDTLDSRITFTRASSATYTDASGVVQTAATNAPRWDYAGGVLRGLLIEEQRTNTLLWSSVFTNAVWSQGNVTLTPNQSGAPDGTATFTRLAETATTNSFYLLTTFTALPASTTVALSLYARAQQNRYLQLSLDDSAANGLFATFDLQTGTVSGALSGRGAATLGTASIQPIGGGTYRCAITGSINAGMNRVIFNPANTGNAGWLPSYAGNPANGLLIFGAHLEQGAFPTSYIPTTSVSVTRAIDVCQIPTNVSWFSGTSSSLLFELNPLVVNNTYGGISDNAFGPNTSYFSNSAFVHMQTAIGSPLIANAVNKTCGVIVSSALAKCCNNGGGIANAAITSAGQPGALRMAIGNDPWSMSTAFGGYIRRVNYWNRALSDAEMQQVTT